MIRHIVTFKFSARDAAGRARSAEALRAALEPLADRVPGVQSLEIGVDDAAVPGHWDAVLVSHHDSYEALADYQVHPDHVAALAVVGELVAEKSVVDYELAPA
ncbi:Dabb family protein [Leucobacter sp.]